MSIFWNIKDKNSKNKEEYIENTGYNSEVKLDLDNINIRNDVLLEIATFLSRRWSDNLNTVINISRENKVSTNIEKKKNNNAGIRLFLW